MPDVLIRPVTSTKDVYISVPLPTSADVTVYPASAAPVPARVPPAWYPVVLGNVLSRTLSDAASSITDSWSGTMSLGRAAADAASAVSDAASRAAGCQINIQRFNNITTSNENCSVSYC